ncbi:unnamed protein product [Cuscuta campestris]|uniref:F-box domain-containing protein n=1 Tax=Cuscuta campestris TaxID=132261 RepID=A0A484N2L2_9ASTE|nr:unnamed protein product [Cuscuta campestris]
MAKPAVRRHAPARDRISQLPIEILDHIMGLLPVQQAAKTAVLSKVWRDVWFSLTRLCFDHDFFSYFHKKYRRASKYVKKSSCLYVINKVLLQHKGRIRKFVFLYGNAGKLTVRSRSFDMDQWTSAFICLLNKCPKLCNLEISFTPEWGEDINKCVDAESKRLKNLRRVLQTHKMLLILQLSSFSGLRPQMHFIQEMLACLPALEKVIISRSYGFDWSKKHETLEEISHFPRASAKAKLVFPS